MIMDSWLVVIMVTVSSFVMGVVDAAIGMGYGTILTPVLLIVGFDPLQVVPAVLVSQLVGGLLASVFHHRFENVDFGLGGEHLRLAIMLGALSAVGAVASVFVAVNLSSFCLSLCIGLMATVLGSVVLVTRERDFGFSWRRMVVIGLLAAFNKGLSGGGYGPVVTAGQIMSGVREKSAVCVTLLSEVLVSLCAVFTFLSVGGGVDWVLTLCLLVGVSLSAPVAAFVVRQVGGGMLKVSVGVVTVLVGLATVLRVVL
jgi:uncharacterized membrane protein YfcA